MKKILPYLIPAAGIAAALPIARADDPGHGDKKEMRVIVSPDQGPDRRMRHVIRIGEGQEKESVTFLGIETRPTDPTLAEQLNLPKGAGLIIRGVVPESPAAGTLKPNDVLVKLDDQLLIEQRQLSVLIRNHQEGDEISLTYIRGGKESTAKVKLAKHEVPKMAWTEGNGSGNFMFHFPQGEDQAEGMDREDMDRVLSLMDQTVGGASRLHFEHKNGPGMHTTTVNTSNSNMVFSDEDGSLDLTIKDGKKTLVAKNAKGEQLFSGPVTTPDERKALPKEVAERLDKLEGMQEFSFQTDDDFEGGKVQVVRPGAKTKILFVPRAGAEPIRVRTAPF